MLYRSTRLLLQNTGENSGGGGLTGFLERMTAMLKTLKVRPYDAVEVLRRPVSETNFRFPSPGSQPPAVIPQGPYKQVFNIAYHERDSRRNISRQEFSPQLDAKSSELPPVAGKPVKVTFLGYAGDFDRVKD